MVFTHALPEARSDDPQSFKEEQIQATLTFLIPKPPPEALAAADSGKKALPRLIKNNDKHAQELGFKSAAEAADTNTRLGSPLPFILLELEKFRKWDPSIDPTSLLTPILRFLYPITVDGIPRSSLTVIRIPSSSKDNGVWRAVGWGAPNLIRDIAVSQAISQKEIDTSHLYFLVRIEELSRYFLAEIQNGKLVIIPLKDEPKYGFNKGIPLPAEFVFRKLLPEAEIKLYSKP
jgi:hypothetical protein